MNAVPTVIWLLSNTARTASDFCGRSVAPLALLVDLRQSRHAVDRQDQFLGGADVGDDPLDLETDFPVASLHRLLSRRLKK
jgi:hypothetical protein